MPESIVESDRKRKTLSFRNSLLLSIAFAICFFGTNSFLNYAIPILGNFGAICNTFVNGVNTFSNLFVPVVISFFKTPERTLVICAFSYLLYIGQFSYIIPIASYSICSLHGFLSAMVWACQGIILGNNSTDEDRGKKSGMFMAIYMFGSAIGNFVSGYIVSKLKLPDTIHNGWNGNASILFLFLACSAGLGTIPLFFIRHVQPNDDKSQVEELLIKDSEEKKEGVWDNVKSVFNCVFSTRMLPVLPFFFFDGYQQIFVTAMFTRQVVDVASIGTIMGIYSIVDVIFSFIHGWLSDRFGHVTVVTLATVFEIAGIIISWFANAQQNWLNYLTGILLAISDAAYQTECLSTVNTFFASNRTASNSSFRMIQCFGITIALFTMPLYVSGNAHHCSPSQYLLEISIAILLACIAYIGYLWFICKDHKRKHNA